MDNGHTYPLTAVPAELLARLFRCVTRWHILKWPTEDLEIAVTSTNNAPALSSGTSGGRLWIATLWNKACHMPAFCFLSLSLSFRVLSDCSSISRSIFISVPVVSYDLATLSRCLHCQLLEAQGLPDRDLSDQCNSGESMSMESVRPSTIAAKAAKGMRTVANANPLRKHIPVPNVQATT